MQAQSGEAFEKILKPGLVSHGVQVGIILEMAAEPTRLQVP